MKLIVDSIHGVNDAAERGCRTAVLFQVRVEKVVNFGGVLQTKYKSGCLSVSKFLVSYSHELSTKG